MKGLCTKIIKYGELEKREGIADYPTYEIIAELNYPIEEGEHLRLELNDILTLRDVQVSLLRPGVYSLAFNFNRQNEMDDGDYMQNYVANAVAAMYYAQQGFLPVQQVIDTLRDSVRAAVPADISTSVELDSEVVIVTVAGVPSRLPLCVLYKQYLLTGPMVLTWSNNELRINHNLPTAHEMEQWFTMHNQTLLDGIEDMPDVAACCLTCVGNGPDGRLQYAYFVAMMDGSCVSTPIESAQIYCMVKTGKCPEVDLSEAADGSGLMLSVFNDDLLPAALPFLEHISHYQLGLTTRL